MHLVFDFDGTITQKDTIGVLAQAAVDFQKNAQGHDLGPRWKLVVEAYMNDYQAYRDSFPVAEGQRQSIAQELRFLSGLKGIETVSLDRVQNSAVFSGLQGTDLFQMGIDAVQRGHVAIRDGFKDVVALAGQKGWGLGVVSVNWSRAFIQGVLHPHSNIEVIANEVSPDGSIEGPAALGHQLTSSSNKDEALGRLVAANGSKALYFGDSQTDMECLLRGGVVISSDGTSSLLRTFSRIGIQVPHVGSRHESANVVWARDFREVLQSDLLDG